MSIRRLAYRFLILLLLFSTLFSGGSGVQAASSITVNGSTTFQVIDGFGASSAFGIASLIRNLSTATQAMDALFSTSTGAGLTIVRLGIAPSFEPNPPSGGPNGTPVYSWNGSDNSQVWFAQTAKTYGANTIYADAWTAPAFMKTNNSTSNGGFLCGLTGSGAPGCSSGDWRQAYANYLTQYAKNYSAAGVNLAYIGYSNEPDFSASYDSMNFDATQTSAGSHGTLDTTMRQNIDFIKNYLGPTLQSSGLTTKISCCEATSWDHTNTYTRGILADSVASNYLGLVTGHAYYGSPNGLIASPISTNGQHVWQTETSTFNTWNTAWDDGSDSSGFQWGQHLWNALVNANVNAYLYWWFAENNSSNPDNEGLLNVNNGSYTISSRLWAFGQYSRFIRPGAIRIGATTSDANLKVSAFQNTNGTTAIVVLNGNSSATSLSVALQNLTPGSSAVPYLTNSSNTIAVQASIPVSANSFSATVPARSLVTYVIGAGSPTTGTPTRTATSTSTQPTFQPATNTPTRTSTPINTATRTTTSTATQATFQPVTSTPTPSATPTTNGSTTLKVQLQKGGTDSTQQSQFNFKIVNTAGAAVSNISVRVYIQLDGTQPISKYVIEKYWDQSGVATVSGPTLATGTTYYYTISFGTASLAAGGSWQYNAALHLSDWSSNFSAGNDFWHTGYAVGSLPAVFTDTANIPAYSGTTRVWGTTP